MSSRSLKKILKICATARTQVRGVWEKNNGLIAAAAFICFALGLALILLAAASVVVGTFYFARLRPGYSHIANTISELEETGAPRAGLVAYGFFLPVGLMVWLAFWLIQRGRADKEASAALLALSCLGTGYVVSAFAPCDPGAPLLGSGRTLVHNLAGLIDYGGTGVEFLLVARRHTKNAAASQAGFIVAGASWLVCLVLLLPVSHIRGGVQRVVEVIQFSGVFFACLLLSKQLPPNERPALDPGTGARLQSGHKRPGASESKR